MSKYRLLEHVDKFSYYSTYTIEKYCKKDDSWKFIKDFSLEKHAREFYNDLVSGKMTEAGDKILDVGHDYIMRTVDFKDFANK